MSCGAGSLRRTTTWPSRACRPAAILVLLSYPVLFVLDRGNLEMVVFILLAASSALLRTRLAVGLGPAGAGHRRQVLLGDAARAAAERQAVRQAVFAWAGCGLEHSVARASCWPGRPAYSVREVLRNTVSTLSGRRERALAALWTSSTRTRSGPSSSS